MDRNLVILDGRLSRDPVLRTQPGGLQLCSLSVATERSWTDNEGKRQKATDFNPVVVFAGLARSCAEHLVKGQEVQITGYLTTRKIPAGNGKPERYSTEVIAKEVVFGRKPAGARGESGEAPRQGKPSAPAERRPSSGPKPSKPEPVPPSGTQDEGPDDFEWSSFDDMDVKFD